MAAGVRLIADALEPLGDLASAGLPLALPALAVVLVGASGLPPLVGFIVAVLGATAAWFGVLRSEYGRAVAAYQGYRSLGAAVRALWPLTLTVLLVAVVLVVVLSALVYPELDGFEARGGISTVLLLLAIALTGIAATLRLAAYVTTAGRLVVTLALLAAAGRLAVDAGLLPGHEWFGENVPATWVVGFAVVVILVHAVIVGVHARRQAAQAAAASATPPPEAPTIAWRVRVGTLGVVAALTGACAIFGATATAKLIADQTDPRVTGAVTPIGSGRVDDFRVATDPSLLARDYAPVLAFTEGQRWSPIPVEQYLAEAELMQYGKGRRMVRSVHQLPTECPGVVVPPCHTLTLDCPDGGDCAMPDPPRELGGQRPTGTAYVRIIKRDKPPEDGSPDPFIEAGPYSDRLDTLLQYWFFYAYDEWVTPVFAGELKQRHEGDWEAVMVGLSKTEPLFVAYSSHCGGNWRDWRHVLVADDLEPRTHPYVAVAEGSQANYDNPNSSRSPDWATCAGIPGDALKLVSYASNIRDRTGAVWTWTPSSDQLMEVDAGVPPMSFPGTWGANDLTTLKTPARSHRLGSGAGPKTPSLQALWREPLRVVFCTKTWQPRGRCRG